VPREVAAPFAPRKPAVEITRREACLAISLRFAVMRRRSRSSGGAADLAFLSQEGAHSGED
jgi:hypothetical protein